MTSRHDDYLYENAFDTALVIIYSDFLKNQVELVSEINQVIQKKTTAKTFVVICMLVMTLQTYKPQLELSFWKECSFACVTVTCSIPIFFLNRSSQICLSNKYCQCYFLAMILLTLQCFLGNFKKWVTSEDLKIELEKTISM